MSAHAKDAMLREAAREWGPHPAGWPVPPRSRPSFLTRHFFGGSDLLADEALGRVFGKITEDMRQRFWSQPGQSPFEDAGGAMLRRYRAMIELPVESLPTYESVRRSLTEEET